MKSRWVRWFFALNVVVWVGIAAYPALAQRRGGSFGGGSFSGGGGSFSGGGGSFSSGRSSYGGSSFSGGSYSSGGYRGGGGGLPCGCSMPLLVGLIVVFVVISAMNKNKGGTSHGARGWSQVDVSAIRLGIDWRARRDIQSKLDALARSGQTGSQAGLANLLRETVLALRRSELAWLYASVANYHPMSAAAAEGIFRQLAVDARSKFNEEVVRDADGRTQTQQVGEMRAHPTEGEGTVVVTLIVAARREILDVHQIDDADALKRLLDDMVGVANPQALVALEVVWSPASENDRMSTAELEQFYPELKKIDERSIAGRVFCNYCGGPFAMELLTCPHCGAPPPGAGQQPRV